MADLTRIVKVAFLGEDKVTKTIDGITGKIDAFAGRVGTATQPLATLTDNILKVEAALAALAIGGLALAIKTAGEFGDSFAEITTLIDAPAEAIDGFRQDILEYSRDSVKSVGDINESIYQAISAGTDYADALQFLSDAEKLSVATKGELSDTIKLVSQTMNAYAGSTLTAQQASDLIFTTIKSGVTRIDELSASLGKVTPISSQLGISFGTISAALAALTKTGLSTSEAVTSLTSLLNSFLKPSSEAAKITEDLGFKWDAATIKSDGFIETLQRAIVAVKGDEEAIGRLTGRKEALIAALVLGVDKAGLFNEALADMAKAAGSTDIAYKKMVENFSNYNQNLINNLKATLTAIGTPLLDDYGDLATAISNLFEGIGSGVDAGAFDPLFNLLEQTTADIVNWINQITEILPEALGQIDWSDFIKSLENLGESARNLFQAFFGEVDLTTVEGLNAFIQKIINGFTSLTNITAGISDAFKPFVEQVGKLADKFADLDEDASKFIGEILGWGKIINTVANNIGALTGSLNFLVQGLTLLTGVKLINAISGMGQFGGAATGLIGIMARLAGTIGLLTTGAFILGDWFRDNIPGVEQMAKNFQQSVLALKGLDNATIDAIVSQSQHTETMGLAAVAAVRIKEAMGQIPAEKTTSVLVKGSPEYQAELDKMIEYVKSVPAEKETKIKAAADTTSFNDTKDFIIRSIPGELRPDGTHEIITEITFYPDKSGIDETKKALDAIDSEKVIIARIENRTDVEIATIKASAETVQKAMEWKAKIEIAGAQQLFESLRQQAQSIEAMFINTGEVISTMFGAFEHLGPLGRFELMELIEKEIAIRAALAEQQSQLTASEIKYLDAKTQALQKGEGFINITMDGVYPELELIMHKLIEQTQIRANAEGLEFLLGT